MRTAGNGSMRIKGQLITPDDIAFAESFGVCQKTLRSRLQRDMPLDEALTTPVKNNRHRHDISKKELIQILGRLKYLKWTYPKGLLNLANELNIDVDEIEPLAVGMEDE